MTDAEHRPFPMNAMIELTMNGLLVAYILSPAPISFSIVKVAAWTGINPDASIEVIGPCYAPLIYVCDRFPAFKAFYDWQFTALGLQ